MKDFFDLWFLCGQFAFDGRRLVHAVRATFERRATAFPNDVPVGLTESFAIEPTKKTQWSAYIRRSLVTDNDHTLQKVVATIGPFLSPVLRAANGQAVTPYHGLEVGRGRRRRAIFCSR